MSRTLSEVSSFDSEVLNTLPSQPGVYLMLNEKRKIIYIGATANLKKRVASYLRKDLPDLKTRRLASETKFIDYEIHKTIEAAFLRERDLIQIHIPRYNIDSINRFISQIGRIMMETLAYQYSLPIFIF